MFNSNIELIILAGLMNGSFVVPTMHVKNISIERVWFSHSIIGVAIIPWAILLLFYPATLSYYISLQGNTLFYIVFGGFIFGIGHTCFAYAIEYIGIAFSFTINLGISVIIGSMFVVFYDHTFFTLQSYLVTFAVLLIVIGLIVNYLAGKQTKVDLSLDLQKNYHRLGWLLASLVGVASGLQNVTFVTVILSTAQKFKHVNPFWVWPPFLFAAAIPMSIGFLYRINKNNKVKNKVIFTKKHLSIRNFMLITLMGICFSGSLALYSTAMNDLNQQTKMVGWPIFMVSIILITQFWGWVYQKKTKNINNVRLSYKFTGILCLVIAIGLLSIKV